MTASDVSGLLFFQGLVVGVLYAAAGVTKLAARQADISRTGFGKLIITVLGRPSKVVLRACWISLGVLEVSLGAWLLSGRLQEAAAGAGIGFGLLAVIYLLWLVKRQSVTSCGCFGTGTPASWRTVARSCFLLAMTSCYLYNGVSRVTTYGRVTVSAAVIAVLLAEAGLIAALSDELRVFSREMRLYISSLAYSARSKAAARESARRRLQRQPAWKDILARLEADGIVNPQLVQSWWDRGWRLLEFSASWAGDKVTVIGAERPGTQPPWRRVAVVDESGYEPRVVMSWDSAAAAAAGGTPSGGTASREAQSRAGMSGLPAGR